MTEFFTDKPKPEKKPTCEYRTAGQECGQEADYPILCDGEPLSWLCLKHAGEYQAYLNQPERGPMPSSYRPNLRHPIHPSMFQGTRSSLCKQLKRREKRKERS